VDRVKRVLRLAVGTLAIGAVMVFFYVVVGAIFGWLTSF